MQLKLLFSNFIKETGENVSVYSQIGCNMLALELFSQLGIFFKKLADSLLGIQ
jgi:hypothetical protein